MADTCTIWVCIDCILHLANGECGSCHEDHPDSEPLSKVEEDYITLGMAWEQHDSSCVYSRLDGPNIAALESLCDCETQSFSWSQCQGCGSTLGGERHAATLWFD